MVFVLAMCILERLGIFLKKRKCDFFHPMKIIKGGTMKHFLQQLSGILLFLMLGTSVYAQNFQFQPLRNLYGGRVNTIARVGVVTLYAGTTTGIYRSSDHGHSWVKELDGVYVNKIVVYSKEQVYAGTNNGLYERRAGRWNKITGFTDGKVNDLGVLSSGVIFVSVKGVGLFKAKTDDNVFSQVTTLGYASSEYRITCDGETVFVDLMMSDDEGKTWKKIDNGWPQFRSLTTLGVNLKDSLIIGGSDNGVYRYNLKTQTWENLNLHQACLDFAMDGGGHIYLGAAGGVYYSSDRGDKWQQLNDGLLGAYVPSVCIIADSVFAATLYGINACGIGQTSWGTANKGISEVPVYSVLPVKDYLIISASTGVMRTKNDGLSWEKTLRMDVGIPFEDRVSKFLQTEDGKLYAGTMTGLYYSNDQGHTWFIYRGYSGQQIYDFVFDKSGNLLKATADGVYRSTDDGLTWTKLNPDTNLGTVTCIAVDSDNHIYAGTYQGAFASEDDGKTWNAMATDSLQNYRFVRLLHHGNYLYAATDKGIFTYDIFYKNWSKSQTGMGEKYVTDLIRTSDDKYYASTYSGIYISADSGAVWRAVDMGDANKNVECLAFDSTGNLYYGTSNNGIYTSKTSLTSVEQQTKETKSIALSGYPNPFRKQITITYVLPSNKVKVPVSLHVFNMLGQKITTLYNGVQSAGRHKVVFRPQGLTPGIYFISLKAGGKQVLRKVVFAR